MTTENNKQHNGPQLSDENDEQPADTQTAPADELQQTVEQPAEQPDVVTDNTDEAEETLAAGQEQEQEKDGMQTEPPRQDKQVKSGRGLALFALLVAIAALAFAIWLYLQSAQAESATQSPAAADDNSQQIAAQLEQRIAELDQQLTEQSTQLNQLKGKLDELPDSNSFNQQQQALKQMQSSYQAFSMRFEAAFGNTRQDWRLAEAEHLLRMAILRLNAMQDLVSARHLIEGADQILFEQDDVAAYPAREALSQALADIKAMPKLDRTGLFLRLGALQNQISQLDQLIPGFEQKTAMEKAADAAFWRQWLDSMSSYIRLDFDSSEEIKPLLASQEVTHIRLAMSLAVEQAQWAALNGQQQAYDKALEQSQQLLQHYFSADNQKASALLAQLDELEGQAVSQQMPDIQPALLALQAYIHDRTLQYRTRSEEK